MGTNGKVFLTPIGTLFLGVSSGSKELAFHIRRSIRAGYDDSIKMGT